MLARTLFSRCAATAPGRSVNPLLRACGVDGRELMCRMGSHCTTTKSSALITTANCFMLLTYAIMINWIYEGYVDLWFGIYGLDEDDEDE